ncbi:MAG: signal peptide peptidase SppA [Vicingus serpentipes]|nr:signal peptide peptidase SppA [Vicingus serpentipes]
MKQFFKYMLATIVGLLVTFTLMFFIFIGVIGALVSSASGGENKVPFVANNSVLHLKFDSPINDRASDNPFESFNFETFEANENLSLSKIIESIEKAKKDDRIEGIYLDLSVINTGLASIEEIRKALNDFKSSGKWIISYSEVYTQTSYYLASVADEIYLNPAGIMELRGLATELMFFKKMLEKMDVEMQIIRHGKFKSAVEPYMLEKMSPSNREQLEKILNTVWGSITNKIAGSRNIEVSEINALADEIKIQNAEDAVKYKFVDELVYKDELLAQLHKRLKLKKEEEIKFIRLGKYAKAKLPGEKTKFSKNKIAIVYASGAIVSGKSTQGNMGSETISNAIREARLDEKVKAIVLRVNSPGGSALASDVIWREVTLAKQVKPVVVSMGDVAASGGYYIACAADKIVASEKTITGSIGVFGVIPNAQGFFNNKLGITFDGVKTNKHADMLTIFKPLTGEEKDIIQIGVERIYDDFITKVAKGRSISKETVDSIGQGRVWVGLDAKEIGLVDEIGGLEEALAIAKKMAKLKDYRTEDYPKRKDPFEQIILELSGEAKARLLQMYLGDNYKYYQKANELKTQSGIMARMPYEIEVH